MEVNYGRWIVACPADDCHASLKVEASELVASLPVTCDCRDDFVCDHPRVPCGTEFSVRFPAERLEIERLLNLRPHRRNRNWHPHESVDDLKAENLRHGVGV